MNLKNKPNEIYIDRIYDADIKTVWNSWVDVDQVGQWWGPRGFTITTHSKDVKTDGHWNYIMHGPNGVNYPNSTKYLDVEKYSRMVYDHGGNADQPPMFRVTVLFSEINHKTKMEMTMALPTEEAAQNTKKFIKQAAGDTTWDRLAEYLFQKKSGLDKFVINRSFQIQKHQMFDIWTNPEKISKWLPPTGFLMTYLKSDISIGGTSFYVMASADGDTKMYGKIHYKKIEKPNQLTYTQIFSDENENITRHPMAPTWPETMLTNVEFCAESETQTRITITWEIFGDATDIERKTFHDAKAGMSQGWTGSFDKLEEYINSPVNR